jgi:glycosyltransferase involved in cell wall biosynthesis
MKKINDDTGLWIGPSWNSKGGVASVIETYHKMGFFESCNVYFLVTMENGNSWLKLKLFIRSFLFFLWNLKSWRFLHVHMSSNASFWRKSIYILVASMFRIPVIIHLHSSSFPDFYFGSGIFSRGFIRYVFGKARKILVLSRPMMELVSHFQLEDRAEIFPNPVIMIPMSSQEREADTVLFIGRIIVDKGIMELIRAISEVKKVVPGVKVLVAGTGQEKLMRTEIRKLDLDMNFIFLGWISGDKKNKLLQEATIMVSPSYNEGQSISILESMMAGLPVICTAVGGNEYLLGQPKTGLTVPAKDVDSLAAAIIRLLQDKELRDRLALLARKRVEGSFEYQQVEYFLKNIYNSISDQHKKNIIKIYGEV